MDRIISYLKTYINWNTFTQMEMTDIIEILILAYLVYHIMNYVMRTRAWALVKGLIVISLLWVLTIMFDLNVLR